MAQGTRVRSRFKDVRIHPTAIIEPGVSIGPHSSVWNNVHIRRNAFLGHHCVVGEKSCIAYDVRIGNFVKINAFVYIPARVTVEDKVMLSAGCIFVNDKYPRAFEESGGGLKSSDPDETTLSTLVKEGATLGAGVTVLADLEIGRYALIGAGSVVTKSVSDHALVVGNPARQIGWVCLCGPRLVFKGKKAACNSCRRTYRLLDKQCVRLNSAGPGES